MSAWPNVFLRSCADIQYHRMIVSVVSIQQFYEQEIHINILEKKNQTWPNIFIYFCSANEKRKIPKKSQLDRELCVAMQNADWRKACSKCRNGFNLTNYC